MMGKLKLYYWACLRELRNQWGRLALAVSAIALATAASILCQSIAAGAFDSIKAYVAESGGLELVRVHGRELTSSTPFQMHPRALSLHDAKYLRSILKVDEEMAPELGLPATTFSRSGKSVKSLLVGSDLSYSYVNRVQLEYGRNLSAVDILKNRRVVVIGKEVERALFSAGEEVVGSRIEVLGELFEVIGVFREMPAYLGAAKAVTAVRTRYNLVPLTVLQEKYQVPDVVTGIHIRAGNSEDVALLLPRIDSALALARPDVHDWASSNREAERLGWEATQHTVATCLLLVTVTTFLIGGFGIVNVMTASVSERVKEIGVRKALGASNLEIGIQLLVESICYSVIGGVIGVSLAFVLIPWVSAVLPPELPGHPTLKWEFVVSGIGLTALLGMSFGFVPALRAARSSPLEAFRA